MNPPGALLGRKLGMTQIFGPDGARVAVTVLEAGPCTVVRKRVPERDGYWALQLGFGTRKPQRVSKPVRGQFAHLGKGGPFAMVREVRLVGDVGCEPGAELRVGDVFAPGDRVQVTGTSKGRGYSGVLKRHGFGGFPGSHGTHEYFRHGGSIGNRSFPGRVFKGKRMAGRYGGRRVTVTNLEVLAVRPEENLLVVRGAVPGPTRGLVLIRGSVRG